MIWQINFTQHKNQRSATVYNGDHQNGRQ